MNADDLINSGASTDAHTQRFREEGRMERRSCTHRDTGDCGQPPAARGAVEQVLPKPPGGTHT